MIETNMVISVSGGSVNGVFTNNPNTKVYLVDYDNLRVDPNEDCGQRFLIERISEFKSRVANETKSFPGIAQLITQINEKTEIESE